MFLDSQAQLANAVALSATALLTNAYDAGLSPVTSATQPDISQGFPLAVLIAVSVAAKVSGGTETYEFDIVQADDAALTVNLTTIAQYPFTNAQAAALLKAGALIVATVPPGSLTRQFVGLKFIGANTPTITISAYIQPMNMIQQQRAYGTKIVVL